MSAAKHSGMIKLFSGFLALALFVTAVANAAEPPGLEVRQRNAIGRMGVLKVPVAVKAEADGSLVASFQAPADGTYILVYTSGPKVGKTAARINVSKAGPVTTKIK